jgi:serine O-acetyltransferase
MGIPARLDRLFHLAFCWEWWVVANYRFAYWASHRTLPHLPHARLLGRLYFLQQATLLRFTYITTRLVEALSGARLNSNAEMGPGLLLAHTGSCGIGPGVRIGHTFTMYQDTSVAGRRGNDPPVIGDNVILFSGARVLGGVNVGDNVRVGANAIVMHDLPSDCTALGLPARPISPSASQPDHSALAQLHDMLVTMLENGDLEELQPGTYRDRLTGTLFNLAFTQPDGSTTPSPPW